MDIAKEIEVVEPEIVESITPVDEETAIQPITEKALAAKQKRKQLEATEKDLEEFLPKVQDSRQAFVDLFFETFAKAADDESIKAQIMEWIRKHPKDATSAISTLNSIAGTITHPQQLQSGQKKRIRLVFGKGGQTGVEISE
jgi:uncharacterized membrane-anchored protein YjiN (DUF445 family)